MRGSGRARQPAEAQGTRQDPKGSPLWVRDLGSPRRRGQPARGQDPPAPCSKTPTHAPAPRPRRVREAPCLLSLPVASLSQLQGNNHIQDTIKHEANPQTTQQHPHVTTQPSSVRGRRASTQQEPSTPARGPGLCPCSPSRKQPGRPKGLRPRGPRAEQQRP